MDSGVMMNAAIDHDVTAAAPPRGGTARRVLAGVVMPAVTAVIAVAGLRTSTPGGIPALQAVAFGLVLVGALSGAVLARAPERVPQWQVASGSLVASVALTAARIGDQPPGGHQTARDVATFAVPVIIAISVHLLLALPDGRLAGTARRTGAALAYAAAAAAGIALVIAARPVRPGQ